jgi:anti-sigma-K factor RskA
LDIQQYISSGILELYAAGALSPEEMRSVERVLADYPDVRRELSDIEDALEQFAMLNAKPPREEVKANLLQKINWVDETNPAETSLKEQPVLKPHATIVPLNNQPIVKSRTPFYLAAASFALFVISAASAMYFFSQWKSAEYELLAISNEKSRTEQEYALTQASLKNMNYDLGIIVHKNTKLIPITAVKEGINEGAVVYWNSVTKDVYLNIDKLPPPPPGKQYQLWAIRGGKPMDEGVFKADSVGIHKMKTVEQPEAFAVTMEPVGGSPQPTMENMMWFGKL